MSTREIYTLRVGRERTERLDIRPLEYGNTVPLRARLQYMDQAGEIHSCAHTIYIAVASSAIARRKGETIRLFSTSNLHTQLAEARKNLLLIRERDLIQEIADGLELLGPLTPLYIPPSNNTIHPFAYASRRPAFHPDPKEVAELLEVPLPLLLKPGTRREDDWIWRGAKLHIPFYAVEEHKVWGATAIVLAEFLALLT